MQDYHSLEVWNRAMDYAVSVYKLAADLPREEKYNLAHQLPRRLRQRP
jgi:four helix bundle protein